MKPRTAAVTATAAAGVQRGVTLIELMVALVIGLVVALATVATLIASRAGYATVDSSSQVRENARFAIDLIQRIAVQAGYEDVANGVGTKVSAGFGGSDPSPEPDVIGYDNTLFAPTTFPPSASNNSTGCTASTSACTNNSDVLILRYQGASMPADATKADGSIINCAGVAEIAVASSSADRLYSVFHVERSGSGEPALMCSYRNAAGTWTKQPLVQGVESFQVLYGMDYGTGAVAANTAVPDTAATKQDSVPDRYLRADQIIVPGDANATRNNWRRVRSLRIGLLLRGTANTALDRVATARTYYPLGVAQSSSGDIGTALAVTADGRLRQELSVTVYLRNRVTMDAL